MGGAAGHLMHLHEDENLTFIELENILVSASNGTLRGVTEKLDGLNIMFSWDFTCNGLVVARSLGDIKRGGINAASISDRIGGSEDLREVFSSSIQSLQKAIYKIEDVDKEKIFRREKKIWYSAEIISSTRPNVVKYDENMIVFHMHPNFSTNENGDIVQVDSRCGVESMCLKINEMQKEISHSNWSLKKPSFISLQMDDSRVLVSSLNEISCLINECGISKSNTIMDYVEKQIVDKLLSIGLEEQIVKDVTSRILKKPGAKDLRKLKKEFPSHAQQIDEVVKGGDKIIKKSLQKIEKIISRFSMKILENVRSSFIKNNELEVKRLRDETETAITKILNSDNAILIDFINQQIEKLEKVENIKTAVEGIVFPYNEKMYKFTGAFAVANQIIGMDRYK